MATSVAFLHCHQESNLLCHQILLGEKYTKMFVESGNESVAVTRHFRCLLRGEIETETEEYVCILLQLHRVSLFLVVEFLAADAAFSASVFEGIEFRSRSTEGAEKMTREVLAMVLHLLRKCCQDGI